MKGADCGRIRDTAWLL